MSDSGTRRILIESGLFDADYYLATYPDVAEAGLDPLDHYIRVGDAEGRHPNEVFKPKLYRRRSMASEPASRNALEHYATIGERQHAVAGPLFRPADYFALNPGLEASVDRPLFHWLTSGKKSNLAATTLPGAQWAQLFDRPLRRSLYELMNFKHALIEAFGLDEGFRHYKEFLALPDTGSLKRKPLLPQARVAAERGLRFVEKEKGGVDQAIEPPRIIGPGNHRTLRFQSRSSYVGCLRDVRLRGGSSLLELDDAVLLDFEGRELENFDTEVDFDAAVFAEAPGGAWLIEPETSALPQIDEAFSLLAARSIAFGHWVPEQLLRYAEARLNAAPLDVPVLIDQLMPPSHRRSLELLYPGIRIIVVPGFHVVEVGKLWFAPNLFFASIHERRNARFKWDFENCSADRARPAMRELGRRADAAIGSAVGPERIFLARRPGGHRQLVNYAQIEKLAEQAGYEKVYPERLDFLDQLRIARNARRIIAPEGSAAFLTHFARPGARVCILASSFTESTVGYRPFLDAIDVEMTIVAGSTVKQDPDFEEWSDFELSPERFQEALAELERP